MSCQNGGCAGKFYKMDVRKYLDWWSKVDMESSYNHVMILVLRCQNLCSIDSVGVFAKETQYFLNIKLFYFFTALTLKII
jgi:hypothetical protein